LLVDDQPEVRRGLRMWLALEPDLIVVGESSDGTDVCPLIDQVHPDVVLMDVGMADRDGITLTAAVHAACPMLPVVVLSLHDDIETRVRALLAGATAFVSKHDAEPSLLRAIRGAASANLH
jgi:DNA-binding NarL/FixJ family response regulator